jgi:hypothetical protein
MESPIVHHLLLCRRASYDLNEPVTPYSLHHLAFRLRPPVGSVYPFVAVELWLFVRVEGEQKVEFWVEVIPVADDGQENELVAAYGPLLVRFGTERNTVSRAWCLRGVPFPTPGWYEIRLTYAGELLATEWIYLEE